MSVPEAPVHENRQPTPGQHHVRAARQVATVQTVSRAEPPKHAAHRQLRSRVLLAHPAHHGGALLRAEDVAHARTGREPQPHQPLPARVTPAIRFSPGARVAGTKQVSRISGQTRLRDWNIGVSAREASW